MTALEQQTAWCWPEAGDALLAAAAPCLALLAHTTAPSAHLAHCVLSLHHNVRQKLLQWQRAAACAPMLPVPAPPVPQQRLLPPEALQRGPQVPCRRCRPLLLPGDRPAARATVGRLWADRFVGGPAVGGGAQGWRAPAGKHMATDSKRTQGAAGHASRKQALTAAARAGPRLPGKLHLAKRQQAAARHQRPERWRRAAAPHLVGRCSGT